LENISISKFLNIGIGGQSNIGNRSNIGVNFFENIGIGFKKMISVGLSYAFWDRLTKMSKPIGMERKQYCVCTTNIKKNNRL